MPQTKIVRLGRLKPADKFTKIGRLKSINKNKPVKIGRLIPFKPFRKSRHGCKS